MQNAINYLFIQHSHQTLISSVAFYIAVLLLLNAETMLTATKRTLKARTKI